MGQMAIKAKEMKAQGKVDALRPIVGQLEPKAPVARTGFDKVPEAAR